VFAVRVVHEERKKEELRRSDVVYEQCIEVARKAES